MEGIHWEHNGLTARAYALHVLGLIRFGRIPIVIMYTSEQICYGQTPRTHGELSYVIDEI